MQIYTSQAVWSFSFQTAKGRIHFLYSTINSQQPELNKAIQSSVHLF